MYSVGQSKVKTWRSCRQAYAWKYEEELIPKRVKRPFTFGRIVHRLIEAEAQGEDWKETLREIGEEQGKLFEAEKELYGDLIVDVGVIMEDYFDYHADGLKLLPVKVADDEFRYAEHEFAIPLDVLVVKQRRKDVDGIVFKGQVDGLGKTPNGLKWLVEHKTFDNLPGEDERWRNVQSVVYVRAILTLGWAKQIDGTCWNYVRSKAPTVPKVLKDGTRLSAQQIVTLPSVIRAALKVYGLSEEAHADAIKRAEEARHEYFQRIYTPLNRSVADAIFDGFVESAIEMRDQHAKRRDKNIGRHCSWCDYEPLCRAQFTGGDVDFIIEREFDREDPEAYRQSGRAKRSDKLKVLSDRKGQPKSSPGREASAK